MHWHLYNPTQVLHFSQGGWAPQTGQDGLGGLDEDDCEEELEEELEEESPEDELEEDSLDDELEEESGSTHVGS